MERGRAHRILRWILLALGGVMVVAGASTIVFGVSSIAGAGGFTASVDSEMRFYAVWYLVMGLLVLRVTRDLGAAGPLVVMVGVGFFAAGCARALSWLSTGRPHTVAVVLMVVELVIPFVVLPLHRRATMGSANSSVS